MKKSILLTILSIAFFTAYSQNKCNCCTEEYSQFDFWIGEWQVVDTNGLELGQNTIVYEQDSCLLKENWTSPSSTGTSNSYYNSADSSWNQVWIDNKGGNLVLKGKAIDGAIVMSSKADINGNTHRISWIPQKNGDVVQRWDFIDSEGQLIQTLFYGIYKPRI